MPRLSVINNKHLLLLCIMFVIMGCVFGQSHSERFKKLAEYENRNPQYDSDKTSFMLPSSGKMIVRYNPLSLLFGSMMYVYQAYFSKQFSASCLYYPTCSQMSRMLIHDFGLLKGVFLSADRLTRCNQIAAAQIHPGRINPYDGKVHETTDVYRFRPCKNCKHVH